MGWRAGRPSGVAVLREPLVGGRSRGLPDLELRQDPCVEWARLLLLQLLGLLLQLLELELELHRSGLLHSRLPGGGILCLVRVVQLRVRGLCGSEALWWCCRRRLLRGLKL